MRLGGRTAAGGRSATGIADVVSAMLGAQAQVMSAAELSVALRLDGVTTGDVRQALWDGRELVKTFGPRGTVHLLPTAELPMWTGALSAIPGRPQPRERAGRPTREPLLTASQADEVVAAIGASLHPGDPLTVDELGAAVIAATGPWAADPVVPAFGDWWPRWRAAVEVAAARGQLCFGPPRGRAVTYTAPVAWWPGFAPAEPRAALRALVLRYLQSYGPATPRHFAQWLAAPPSWSTELFDSLADDLVAVRVDGTESGEVTWLPRGDSAPPTGRPAGVRLLPYFDAYVIGCHPRARVFPGAAADRALTGGQAGTVPVVLVAGEVAGVWHQRRSGRRALITVELLSDLSPTRRAELAAEAERTGEMLGLATELEFGEVRTGRHL